MSEMDIQRVMELLPHRYPLLLVDRIIECDYKTKIVGLKNVSVNEPCFQGHFPGNPVMPGVLQLEAMAQTAGILMITLAGEQKIIPYFMAIDKAKFRKVVRPGDQLRIEVELTKIRRKVCRFEAKALVDGGVASEAEMTCMMATEEDGS
jgi:beta-hydroxyacyl-ACP dehydratase FabZ